MVSKIENGNIGHYYNKKYGKRWKYVSNIVGQDSLRSIYHIRHLKIGYNIYDMHRHLKPWSIQWSPGSRIITKTYQKLPLRQEKGQSRMLWIQVSSDLEVRKGGSFSQIFIKSSKMPKCKMPCLLKAFTLIGWKLCLPINADYEGKKISTHHNLLVDFTPLHENGIEVHFPHLAPKCRLRQLLYRTDCITHFIRRELRIHNLKQNPHPNQQKETFFLPHKTKRPKFYRP